MARNRYLIEYYTQDELAYSNRKRYKTFSFNASSSEYQYAVRLDDGASTSIKTSLENLSNYVCISLQTLNDLTQLYDTVFTTRWYVTSYIYLNGGQIELFLQRDVIGENGLEGFFGKVERGYTETFLRNRKELSLNQRLIKRTPLIPSNNKYGNYSVSTHKNEKWGVIYLTKPTELDPITGLPYENKPVINIPAFAPQIMDYTYIADGTDYISGTNIGYLPTLEVPIKIIETNAGETHVHNRRLYLRLNYDTTNNKWFVDNYDYLSYGSPDADAIQIIVNSYYLPTWFPTHFIDKLTTQLNGSAYDSMLPKKNNTHAEDYNGKIIQHEGDYLQYTVTREEIQPSLTQTQINNLVASTLTLMVTAGNIDSYSFHPNSKAYINYLGTVWYKDTYNYVEIDPFASSTITLDITQQLIDEPYICYVTPLYDVTITGPSGYEQTIDSTVAFMIFNTIIQYCSGENSYLVDAQIYPYCPYLTTIAASIGEDEAYPYFNINSSSFNTSVDVELKPYIDIKKEYIKRDYYIVSPEQSANYHFNFYDYTNVITEDVGDDTYNYEKLNIVIKTALKPMNIVASAVITTSNTSLKGITYVSDLRGCQPTGGGFEFSLSTNKFQEYVRNNSNYQQIFALQQQELKKQHDVELANDITSAIVNTTTATSMGAIGGMALGSAGIASAWGTKALAAGIGASVAGTTVGAAMTAQTIVNSKLREYEEYLQKQNFDLQIGTIKNIPNTVSRISSFNEIIMQSFCFVIETYECSEEESLIVDKFIENYAYGIGVFGEYKDFEKDKWFLRGTLIKSNLLPILHNVAQNELMGGIYYNE